MFEFQAISWFADDIDHKDDNETVPEMKYTMKIFGRNIEGKSVSMTVNNFRPYFFVKADVKWNNTNIQNLKDFLNLKLSNQVCHSATLVQRKEFVGFTNDEEFDFVRLSFKTVKGLRFAAKILSIPCVIPSLGPRAVRFKGYESNIDPFLKFMHEKNIKPCGWVRIPDSFLTPNKTVLLTHSQLDLQVHAKHVTGFECETTVPFSVLSFDIECTSAYGDFPVPKKTYKQFAGELYDIYQTKIGKIADDFTLVESVRSVILFALGLQGTCEYPDDVHALALKTGCTELHATQVAKILDDVCALLKGDISTSTRPTRDNFVNWMENHMGAKFPKIHGDAIIQIGMTIHKYGERECSYKHIITLGGANPIEGAVVECCDTEEELLLKWRDAMVRLDPDIVTGYNIFGFDFEYIVKRAEELNIMKKILKIGRFKNKQCSYVVKTLTSSALGENILKFIEMDGRISVDMMKLLMRDMKFETFKLDHVASQIVGQHKNDVSPKDIFRLQKGSDADRTIVAEYCIQDCELCNKMMIKLEVLANNMAMADVCLVPLAFIFNRGQGIKIFSLVLKQCREDGYLIPVIKPDGEEVDNSFEGALVLEPKAGIYMNEPVTVLDFSSLYPSCLISENLSHDQIVLDPKYDNLPGVEYVDISYDEHTTCRFAQKKQGVIPRILIKLLQQRKDTRKKAKVQRMVMHDGTVLIGHPHDVDKKLIASSCDHFDDFQKAVLDGLQNAFKVTANSLYGQIGARTSAIHMKDIAACTTATGRKMINMAKDFIEKEYQGDVIYGDTDSLFVTFPNDVKGHAAIMSSIQKGIEASSEFKKLLKAPHDLEYEKTFYPFILLSKKRYVGNQYKMDDKKFSQQFMGIVLKRRDNANIVKKIYGGVLNLILDEQDIDKSVKFLNDSLEDLVAGRCPFEDLVLSKSLKSGYKDPTRIAHKVLAERIGERSPGNKPQVNDRLQYIFVENANNKALQGERIETPEFIREMSLPIDYNHYITNQLMNPILQLFAVVIDKIPGYNRADGYFDNEYDRLLAEGVKTAEKCKDRIQALKEKYIEELLFKRFLKVKITASAAKKALALATSQQRDANGILMSTSVEMNLVKPKKAPRVNITLQDMTLVELKAEATKLDIAGRSKFTTKATLLACIIAHTAV